jgi:two-component system cell cycle sensor histidine kinase/response regulator CckA
MSQGDVSEEELLRLRAENEALRAALASEEEKFRLVFHKAPVAIGILSFEEARFLDVNERYLGLSGATREEFFRNDPYEAWVTRTHPEDLEVERALLKRMVEGQIDSYRLKKRYLSPSGEWRWADFASDSVRDERGRLRYSILQFFDIHEQMTAVETRERLEERLRQAQKLETVGRLVGGVAHDFNNRLLVIMGYAELLKRGTLGNPELEGQADVVLTSARRAADLTRQLLAFGRRQVLKPCSADPNALVDRMRRMLERLIGESVELVTVLGAKHPMHADTGQIEQVLMNLVLNARDAMPAGGRVTIETADAVVPAGTMPELAPGAYVTFSVVDTGPGIPEAVREQIFEPFFTTKDVGKGTGLGLAMVDGIVRQSGGVVSVKSVEGRGATFTVYLPRAVEARSSETPQPFAAPAAVLANLETVLVVDDEDEVRQLLVDVLAIGAYHVLEARDGERALEVAEKHARPIDLLVTDVAMPKMKGPELAERLRQRQPTLPTLYISGYAERDTLSSLAENEHFLAKPFSPADLYRLVRDILATRAAGRVDRAG